MNRRLSVVIVALTILAVAPASAQEDAYDNGPTNGTVDAWTINFGFIVSDTFTLGAATNIDSLTFAAWLFPGDVLESAEVSITSSEFGGTTYFDGIVNFAQSGCVGNQYGFNVCNEQGSVSVDNLQPGTYWLNLQNAVVNTGDPIYWDENSGPSQASASSVGTIPSESFTLGAFGCGAGKASPDCGPPPTSPEPGSLVLFGSGIVAMFGAARRFMR